MVNKVRTLDFLPEIFRTIPNSQFLKASLDVITDRPNFKRVEGFIGEKYGYGVEPNDRYVVEPTKARADYQLDPGVIFLKDDTQTPQDFINYSGILSSLKLNGANTTNHNRLFENEFYSWDPFVDYDKIVNYAQYYWIPNGPDAIPITPNIVYSTGSYTITNDINGYTFDDTLGINPVFTVLRGGTYTFTVPAGSNDFWIQTVPGIDATVTQRTVSGVTNNGTNSGTITFVVPDALTLVNTKLYYQSGSDPNSVGEINLIDSNASNKIFIDNILGKKTYTSPNGISFINGLKVEFDEYVSPSSYANKQYYVEGVGTSIQLLPVSNFIAGEISGEALYNPWDMAPWDYETWDAQLYVPLTPEYITITRNSRDYNAWTRSNRWFHQDVLDTTTNALGYVTNSTKNTVTRAQRPIIEYRGNLKLFDSGVVSLGPVNIVNTNITDAFSSIEGNTISGVGLINGTYLFEGARIVFAGDTNPLVRKNVYIVTLVPTMTPSVYAINLAPDTTINVRNNSQVFVPYVSNIVDSGTSWWFNGSDNSWNKGQIKTSLNQYPLYDIFDLDGISLGDKAVYEASSFTGCKLFSYTEGSGPDDPVLGFPIAYSNPSTIGDILFTVNLNSDEFTYVVNSEKITLPVNIGFVHHYIEETLWENLSGWITAAGPSFQYQVFEFPVIENYIYSVDNTSIQIVEQGSGYAVGDRLKILGTSLGGTSPENDLTFVVETVSSGKLTGILTSSFSGKSVDVNRVFYNCEIVSISGVGSSAIASVTMSGPGTITYTCDVLALTSPDQIAWNPVIVYYNDNILDEDKFIITRNNIKNTTSVKVESSIGSKITVLLISNNVSKTAYYQTPSNLENNPFNANIVSVNVGDLKNQYRSIFSNAPGVTGQLFGSNNINNLGNLNKYGTSIIQNSASLVLPGLFLRKPQADIYKALDFNKEQYIIYKNLLVDLVGASDYSIYTPANEILDDILYKISSSKNSTSAFFWSDMLFNSNPYATNVYNINADTNSVTYNLSLDVWSNNMFEVANYKGIGVYLTRIVAGKETTTQLLKNVNYVVSNNTPSVTINYSLNLGDKITIKEYNQTYGSYCPNTPSKLGLYPIFIPSIVEITTDNYFILGHDGSLTKLYGNYNTTTGALDDFRDQVLYEFEKRIYNNFKVEGEIPLNADDVLPGQFRTTEYTYNEILEIYTTKFLDWVGANRLDYKKQYYNQSNKFTYNYNQSSNKLDNSKLLQGYWRGIYTYLYDTDNPGNAPWEMLGFNIKPSWWDAHYGPAPYTSGNTYMWQEIADGYVWNNGDPYINTKRIRPALLSILPVDSYGNTRNPFDVIVGNYSSLTFNRDWVVGDGSPVEFNYLKSSTYPYDLMRLLALTKPAKFFNLFVDRDRYKFNDVIVFPGQYLYDQRYHLDPRTVQVYGNGIAKHSYINWVVDSINQFGENGTDVITKFLKNLDVRLVYNMAGFTAKNYLKFLIEKASPNSNSNSLLVPDENYTILLYDNPAVDTVIYSSIIIQKVTDGYVVFGNSKSKNYFTIQVPKNVKFDKITVNQLSVDISTDFYEDKTLVVPYGTQFYNAQSLCQFIQNYGYYLTKQGIIFDNIIDGVLYDWTKMIQNFLIWAQQNWEVGTIISINPNARNFTLKREGLVPQPLTIQGENYVLNQNLLPIQNQNMAINRENELLDIEILSPGDTISYSNINLSSIEHAIVFDNQTSFNDTIYNLGTGLRQTRLLLRGYKTAEWSGYINTSGFILNENNVQNWEPNTKYPKNKIVIYKNKYYTARKLIEPIAEFLYEDWLETEYGEIKSGLLPNPSTVAYEAQFYYDTNRANLENDADLLSFSLIGFRPRDYLAAADLSDITQINVYKNIIKTKGTKLLAESFSGAQLEEGEISYTIQENWAIKSGDFGAVLNSNFVEVLLNQSLLTGNPTLIGFAANDTTVPLVQQSVQISELINYERPPLTNNFLPKKLGSYALENGIPSAGYVNLNDSKLQSYFYDNLNDNTINITSLNRNETVWIANYKNGWDIFNAASLENQIISLQNNLNNTCVIEFQNIHNLVAGDLIAIFNFDYRVNGFYVVVNVPTTNTVTINLNLDFNVTLITGFGVGFKLISRRFEQASDSASLVIPYSQWSPRKIWVDYDANSQWAVYEAGIAYKQSDINVLTSTLGGLANGYSTEIGKLMDDGAGNLTRVDTNGVTQVITGSGVGNNLQMKVFGEFAFVSSTDQNFVYVHKLNTAFNTLPVYQIINPTAYIGAITGAIAVSSDCKWLYIGNSTGQQIAVYVQNSTTLYWDYVTVITPSGVPGGSGWAASLATSTDGIKLVVGAPYETVSTLSEAGAVYTYTRRVQKFYANGVTSVFTLENASPNNAAIVYINDVITTSVTVVGTTVTFSSPPADGSIVTVSTGYFDFVQRFQSDEPHLRAWFGLSVDTNRYGADVLVGSPYEISTVDNIKNVEGAVYRYTNGAQRYGVKTTTITGSLSGTIFIDGYRVSYSGNITSIRDSINNQTPTNIIASTSGNVLTITVKEDTPEVLYNIIDITGPFSTLAALGIVSYDKTQVIKNFDLETKSAFGYNVKMNERDSLLISAITKRRKNPTTFDFKGYCTKNETYFDNDVTVFVDSFSEQGMVYLYDYLPAHNESISNPGKYAFGQYLSTETIANNVPAPKFGFSLSYSNGVILIGAQNYTTTQKCVVTFTTNWTPSLECEVPRPTSWYVNKLPLPIVDINSISNISLYNTINNETLEFLDYIDPEQGKLLGAVATNIDYMSSADPAVYNLGGVYWTWDHLGEMWLDLSTIRILNYHQPDINYNSKNWGKAFPGSTADIYVWIESNVPPISYTGEGIPINLDDYNSVVSVDNATNSLITKYYFWVKNYNIIPQGKTISSLNLSLYLINPINSGIGYLAPITTNIVGLYNSSSYILSNNSALHIGYGLPDGLDDKHTSWSLIRDNNPQDFLSGLPTILGNEPSGLYLKFIESFSGFDNDGNIVPDPRLPALVKYGTSFRPRQSMFVDRLLALNNYITYANDVLIKLPICEMRDISYLQTYGIDYDTRNYWEKVNWWAEGYDDNTKAVIEVTSINDLQSITEDTLLVNIEGINVLLIEGLIAKVKANQYGLSEYYIYSSQNNGAWTRIGAEDSTIQISPDLYRRWGWDVETWDGLWDKTPIQEIVWVIRWLNEQCYIGELSIEKNRSLILMFKFIQSESLDQNNYLPWLNKTSLVDVKHQIRGLFPYKKYQRDNQEFLEGFLNEIKPYHVYIKEFIYGYYGFDEYFGSITDFDLPAEYNPFNGKFETPQLVDSTTASPPQYNITSDIWNQNNYAQWFANKGIKIDNFEGLGLPITKLSVSINSSINTIVLQSTYGLPLAGVISIGSEQMSYSGLSLSTNTLTGVTRGINGTLAASHTAGDVVSVDLPSVIVLASGRGYVEPPKITAYIDTTIYPQPAVVADLEPIMAGDRLIGVHVKDGGQGYLVAPEIIIEGSPIDSTFAFSAVNTTANTISITSHPFQDGDSVIFSLGAGSTSPAGLTENQYYYVRVINANTIALFENYENATRSLTSPYLHISTDDGRVDLKSQGSGSNLILTVTARAICLTNAIPVREAKIKLNFDRLSYTYTEGVGSAAGRINTYYEPTLSMPGKNLKLLMNGVETPESVVIGPPFTGATLDAEIAGPAFTSSAVTSYDLDGNTFPAGYTPEELVGGYVWDELVMTVETNDTLNWTHTLTVDRYGNRKVYNDSGVELLDAYEQRWWYGRLWFNPLTDPDANTTLSVNINPAAVFLRS